MPDMTHAENYTAPRQAWYQGYPVKVVDFPTPDTVTIKLQDGSEITVSRNDVEVQ